MTKTILTQERLKEVLNYNPDTGEFTRRIYCSPNAQSGDVPGTETSDGYLEIVIDGGRYKAHRLAWLFVYGVMPKSDIDHINHIGDDNRISNLRDVSHQDNGRNQKMRATNKSGVMGVYWFARYKKWQAYIHANGKRIHLGYFITLNDAARARKIAEVKYGYHINHGAIQDGGTALTI